MDSSFEIETSVFLFLCIEYSELIVHCITMAKLPSKINFYQLRYNDRRMYEVQTVIWGRLFHLSFLNRSSEAVWLKMNHLLAIVEPQGNQTFPSPCLVTCWFRISIPQGKECWALEAHPKHCCYCWNSINYIRMKYYYNLMSWIFTGAYKESFIYQNCGMKFTLLKCWSFKRLLYNWKPLNAIFFSRLDHTMQTIMITFYFGLSKSSQLSNLSTLHTYMLLL